MDIILGQTVTIDFTTHNPLTGQVQDCDFLPVIQIFEDATDIPIVTPTAVRRLAQIGDYRVTFTVTAALGYHRNSSYNVIATATVAGITAKGRIQDFSLVTQTAGAVFTV